MGCKVGFITNGTFCTYLVILRYLGPVPHDISYYSKCMLGGVLACGVTHAGITPLDVAKCNMQVCLTGYSVRMYKSLIEIDRSTL
jgi:hypothetical protein